MPFTPYHFGPHPCVALPLNRYIDIAVFIGANIMIELEPILVLTFKPNYPLQGYCHTFKNNPLQGCQRVVLRSSPEIEHCVTSICDFIYTWGAGGFSSSAPLMVFTKSTNITKKASDPRIAGIIYTFS
jgi:hypothetical protein